MSALPLHAVPAPRQTARLHFAALLALGLGLLAWLPHDAAAAITYVNQTSTTAQSNSLTVSVPGTQANDILLTQISLRGGTGITITAPAGWTLISHTNNGTVLAQAIYYRIASASEPAAYTWGFSSSQYAVGGMLAFRGVDISSPIHAFSARANTDPSKKEVTAGSVTTTVAETRLVGFFGNADGRANFTPPVGMTERYDTQTGGGQDSALAISAADAVQTAAGASGDKVSATTQAAVSIGHLVVLNPRATAVTPGGFNAVEVGANAITGVIRTKVAGLAYSLDVAALNSARTAVETAFSESVKVELIVVNNSAPALDANGCPVGATVRQTLTPTLANGRATIGLAADAEAWRYAKLRISYPATGTASVVACSTDAFAVRPSYLAGQASDATWETAGTARVLDQTSAASSVYHKAGRPFTLRATAYNAVGAITGNYDGSPAGTIGACTLPTTGCVTGSLALGNWAAAGGTATSNTASYSEAGAVSLTLSDADFAAVDAADGSTAAERTVATAAFSVGRFVPDHFVLSAASLTPACAGATPCTYLGQDFTAAFSLSARNASGGLTANYTGTLAKLSPSAISNFSFAPANLASDDTPARLRTPASLSGSWLNGQAGLSGAFSVGRLDGTVVKTDASRPVRPDGPFPNFLLAARPADPEGVTLLGTALDVDTDGDAILDRQRIGGGLLRFGRLRLANAYGSELLALPVPLTAQYWNGQGFVVHGDDSCTTTPALAAVPQTNPLTPGLTFYPQSTANQLAAGETSAGLTSPLAAGSAGLTLSAPGAGNFGYVDVTATAPAWLKYNWDGVDQLADGNHLDDNPSARAAFGKRRGQDRVIIRREIY